MSGHGLDFETPVVCAVGAAVPEAHERRHGERAADVRDVEAFDARRADIADIAEIAIGGLNRGLHVGPVNAIGIDVEGQLAVEPLGLEAQFIIPQRVGLILRGRGRDARRQIRAAGAEFAP